MPRADYVETTAQSLADQETFVVKTKAANAALSLPTDSPPIVAPVITPRFLPVGICHLAAPKFKLAAPARQRVSA